MIRQTSLGVILKKTAAKITPRAGLILVEKVAQELGIEQLLGLHFCHLKKREKGLSVARQILDIACMLIDGGDRMEDIRCLRADEGWQKIREAERVMAPRTARDVLYRFDERMLEKFEMLEKQVTHRMTKKLEHGGVATLDADATFIEAGKEESKMSYHGRRGYYPMLGFWAERGMVVQGEFRQGNESPGSRALEFLKKCIACMPREGLRLRVRADAAWFQSEVADYCDGAGAEFAIGGTRNEAMLQAVEAIPKEDWEPWTTDPEVLRDHPEQRDWEIAESVYAFEDGRRSYRLVVIRKSYPQLDMFKGIIFEYDIIITNMQMEKRHQIRWYWERCNSENWIKELKYGFGLDQFPCSRYLPNGAYFHIVLLAYNLVQALKLLKLDYEWRYMTVKTLRYRLLHVAGLVVSHARQLFLKLFHRYPYYELFHRILCTPAT
jgi:hypothetical protein